MIDYHIHTNYSDGEGSLEEVCRVAQERKIKEIGIIDHLILAPIRKIDLAVEDIPKRFEKIESVGKSFKVELKIGIEIDYFEDKEKQIEKIIDENIFDFVLGSTHFIDGMIIDERKLYENFSQLEVYKKYFSRFKDAVGSGLFDVMAHPDYIRRFSVPFYKKDVPIEKYKNRVGEIAELLADKKIGIEVNASGLRHNMINDSYPTIDFLKVCREAGVKIVTIGSDAHLLKDIGYGLEKCLEKLRTVGYDKVVSFTDRKPKLIPIKSF